MKKSFFLAVFCMVVSFSAQSKSDSTQYKQSFLSLKMSEGWFLGASVGGHVYWGSEDNLGSFSSRLSPSFSFYGGKWILPYVGLRLGYDGFKAKGFSKSQVPYSTGELTSDGLYKNNYGFNNLRVDFMYNLSERICKDNPKRVYSFIPYAGLGLFQIFGDGTSSFYKGKNNEYSINVGLINQFRITQNLSANVELQAILLRKGINGIDGSGGMKIFDIISPLKVGITYQFGKNKATRGVEMGYVESLKSDLSSAVKEKESAVAVLPQKNAQISAQKNEINVLRKEIETLKMADNKKVVEEVVPVVNAKFVVFFASSSHGLNAKDKVTLSYAAEVIKSAPNQKFILSAYADPQTGTKEMNKELSQLRADAVYDVLVNTYGVNSEQLIIKANGQENVPYDGHRLNRVVIIEPNIK